ncbi:hypothetical protein NLM27_32225 [Bradyrhizobium sp. CCGB12]|uniref:hypothetical protein n=1 Tax=Bradyrhizobium sp. CCGB12 TaxID=2949632 RepID=UPI0020B3E2B1|nr:hypothetical protein [Bradyrhizobium sp. CCGB12]MCP3393425.1 hypothetical protein [Bradyrhizobium sp. CCGB12]
MTLLFAFLFSEWTCGDEPAHQAIVRRKGQTPEVAATAVLQCETNHIFAALTLLTSCRQVAPERIEHNHDNPFIPLAQCPCLAVDRSDKVESPSG